MTSLAMRIWGGALLASIAACSALLILNALVILGAASHAVLVFIGLH